MDIAGHFAYVRDLLDVAGVNWEYKAAETRWAHLLTVDPEEVYHRGIGDETWTLVWFFEEVLENIHHFQDVPRLLFTTRADELAQFIADLESHWEPLDVLILWTTLWKARPLFPSVCVTGIRDTVSIIHVHVPDFVTTSTADIAAKMATGLGWEETGVNGMFFHGTTHVDACNIIQDGISREKCGSSVDFGRAFYLSESLVRAVARGRQKHAAGAAVLVFRDPCTGCRVHDFGDAMSAEWVEFVTAHRSRDRDAASDKYADAAQIRGLEAGQVIEDGHDHVKWRAIHGARQCALTKYPECEAWLATGLVAIVFAG